MFSTDDPTVNDVLTRLTGTDADRELAAMDEWSEEQAALAAISEVDVLLHTALDTVRMRGGDWSVFRLEADGCERYWEAGDGRDPRGAPRSSVRVGRPRSDGGTLLSNQLRTSARNVSSSVMSPLEPDMLHHLCNDRR